MVRSFVDQVMKSHAIPLTKYILENVFSSDYNFDANKVKYFEMSDLEFFRCIKIVPQPANRI